MFWSLKAVESPVPVRRVACASRGFALVPLVVVQGMVHEAGRDILALGLGEIGLFNGSAK